MAEEDKDKMVRLVNSAGVEEDVWDFPGHVDRLLTIGWTRPVPGQPLQAKLINNKNDKEIQ